MPLQNLFLVGESAGYPSVPGVIGDGMDVVELVTVQPAWGKTKTPEVKSQKLVHY